MEQSPWAGTGGFVDLLCCCCRRDLVEESLGCCLMMFLILAWMCVPISLVVTGEVVWCRSPVHLHSGILSLFLCRSLVLGAEEGSPQVFKAISLA